MSYSELLMDDGDISYGTTSRSVLVTCHVGDQLWIEASSDTEFWKGHHTSQFSGFMAYPLT